MASSLLRAWAVLVCCCTLAARLLRVAAHEGISGLGDADRLALLDHHNRVRREQNSSSMYVLVWDAGLAQSAQTWADECWFQQGHPTDAPAHFASQFTGQNLWYISPEDDNSTSPADAVLQRQNATLASEVWANESAWYSWENNTCDAPEGETCTHFLTMVTDRVRLLGCGYKECSTLATYKAGIIARNAHFVICNYWPLDQADIKEGEGGDFLPFQRQGAACTGCLNGYMTCDPDFDLCAQLPYSECHEAGCECRADCQNNASLDADCRCHCAHGYSGLDCRDECRDLSVNCGKGYQKFMCSPNGEFSAVTRKNCPDMCGLCGGEYTGLLWSVWAELEANQTAKAEKGAEGAKQKQAKIGGRETTTWPWASDGGCLCRAADGWVLVAVMLANGMRLV